MSLKRIRKFFLVLLIFSFLISNFSFIIQLLKTPISKNIVDKIYLAKQNPNVVDNFNFGVQKAQAAEDPAELEYMVDVGPVNGVATANYVFASFFNPSGSGRTAVIKRIAVRANAVAGANYVNLSVRRTTAASNGTQITAADIPKKNDDSSNPVTEVRHTGVTVTFAGITNSRILGQATPGAAGQWHSIRDITFGANDEKLVIQPNEGIALYQEAAGDADQRIRIYIEWEEVASAPSAQNEFLFTFPWVKNAAGVNYVYNSFLNPAASGKTAIVKRIGFGTNTSDGAAAIYQNIALRRTSAASNGTAISASDVPEKNTSGATSVMDFRHTNVTCTLVGGADARLGLVTPGTTGYPTGWQEIKIQDNDEKLILQPGEGIALITEASGDVNQLARIMVEWQEVASGSTPSSQGEYLFAYPRVVPASAPAANTNFYTFFNPSGSGKTVVVKRLGIRNNADTSATYAAFTWRRISAASNGVAITASDAPKKHSSTGDTAMELRYCGTTCGTAVSATYSGSADSRLLTVNGPGTAQQVIGQREIVFGDNEKIVLQEGEGIGFYNEAAGDIDHYYKAFIEWDEESSPPSSAGEYLIDIGPVNGSTSSGYVYNSFFNPAASGKTAIVKKISLRTDTQSGALYIPMSLRRLTAASGGTQITAANIPKKHASTGNSAMEVRRTNVTVSTWSGSADSRITSIHTPGAVGTAIAPSISGYKEFDYINDERIILQAGEGFALYQEVAGDGDFRVKLLIEWQEVASGSTPSSRGEYQISSGPVAGSTSSDYVYESLFNPSGSNKNYVVKRIEIRANRTGTLVAPGYIPVTLRETSAASGGTSVAQADVPKKHSSTGTTTAEIRHTGPTVTFAGVADSRLLGFTVPGTVNQYGDYSSTIIYQDELILAPGEGIALYQEATAGDSLLQFRFAFEWSESDISGTITSSTTGAQVETMDIPSSNNYVDGAFTFIRDIGSTDITQIIVTETGDVNANANLSDLDLYYETAGTCSYEGTETLFGTAASFNASEKATVTGTMSVGTSQVCVYALVDVDSGASNGQTLDIEINSSSDVTVSSGSVGGTFPVAITDSTTLQAGTLTVDIVDSGGNPVGSPSLTMNAAIFSFTYQTSNGTFGTSDQRIRIDNSTSNPQWTLTIAANSGPTAFWDGALNDYDFNDPTANAEDGPDADSLGGQMTLNASAGTLTPEGGCTNTGLTLYSSGSFSEGATDSVSLITAGATAETNCYWDLTGVSVSQTIPAEQYPENYSIYMTLTVTAI